MKPGIASLRSAVSRLRRCLTMMLFESRISSWSYLSVMPGAGAVEPSTVTLLCARISSFRFRTISPPTVKWTRRLLPDRAALRLPAITGSLRS